MCNVKNNHKLRRFGGIMFLDFLTGLQFDLIVWPKLERHLLKWQRRDCVHRVFRVIALKCWLLIRSWMNKLNFLPAAAGPSLKVLSLSIRQRKFSKSHMFNKLPIGFSFPVHKTCWTYEILTIFALCGGFQNIHQGYLALQQMQNLDLELWNFPSLWLQAEFLCIFWSLLFCWNQQQISGVSFLCGGRLQIFCCFLVSWAFRSATDLPTDRKATVRRKLDENLYKICRDNVFNVLGYQIHPILHNLFNL